MVEGLLNLFLKRRNVFPCFWETVYLGRQIPHPYIDFPPGVSYFGAGQEGNAAASIDLADKKERERKVRIVSATDFEFVYDGSLGKPFCLASMHRKSKKEKSQRP